MTLHRFLVGPEAVQTGWVVFPPDQSHQIKSVLRLRAGERIIVLDGTGMEYVARLETVGSPVTAIVEERRANQAEPVARLTLYQGVIKSPKLEIVLQKCTEIGVAAFVPMVTQRSVALEPGTAKQRRFETIVREAVEQSGRGRIPTIAPVERYANALRNATRQGTAVLLWEDERSHRLDEVPLQGSLSLLVGPEGGFAADEVQQAREMGMPVVTLGRRILRAETAAIVGSTLLLARAGELG